MGFWDGSGISWTICKQSAPHSRQVTTPTPHHSMFTGRVPFLTPNQQCQSTEVTGTSCITNPQQIEVLVSDGVRALRVVNSHDASSVASVVNKLDRRRVVEHTIDVLWRHYLKSRMWTTCRREVPLIHDLLFLPISTIESGMS